MGIVVKHGKPSTIIAAAQRAGEAQAAAEVARRAQEKADRLEAQKMEAEYRTALRQQDMVIDLQMNERAKLWEIEKMEMTSRMDFQREEQIRQRKLDSLDSALQQIDKEILAGRMTEEEAYPLKQKYELNKLGVDAPVSLLPTGDEGGRFGVQPYWMKGKDALPGSPERMLYEAEMKRRVEGRAGTVPYHLSPEFLRTLPSQTAQDMLMDKGIFFDSDEEFEEWLVNLESAAPPLSNKQLDVGVRAEIPETFLEQVMPGVLPEPTTKTEFDALLKGTRFRAPDGTVRVK